MNTSAAACVVDCWPGELRGGSVVQCLCAWCTMLVVMRRGIHLQRWIVHSDLTTVRWRERVLPTRISSCGCCISWILFRRRYLHVHSNDAVGVPVTV